MDCEIVSYVETTNGIQMKAKIFDTTVTKVNEVLIFLIWKIVFEIIK